MSGAWVDKADNAGMANWGLHSNDIYGAVVLGSFAAMACRAFDELALAMTPDRVTTSRCRRLVSCAAPS